MPFDVLNATFYSIAGDQAFVPVRDCSFFQDSLISPSRIGRLAPVNIIVGCNSDEGLTFASTTANTTAELSTFIRSIPGLNTTLTQNLLGLYRISTPAPPYSQPLSLNWPALTAAVGVPFGNQTRRAAIILGDYLFHAGRRFTASPWTTAAAGHKAYSFRFDTDVSTFPLVYTPGLGVGFSQHGAELSYEFRIPYVSPTPYPPLPNVTAMHKVSYAMQAQWTSFAAMDSSNRHRLSWVPSWPSYDQGVENFVFNGTLGGCVDFTR